MGRLPQSLRIPTIPRRILIPIVLLGLASEVASAAGTYYVDRSNPACSNTGAGTAAQPYCTISAAAAARGGPGVTIRVAPGVYPEQVTITASGLSESPFDLIATGNVVLDGADDFSDPARWTQVSGNVWLAAGVTWSPRQVFADGVRLAASTAAPASLPPNTFRWVAGAGLYVNAGGGNPAGHQARVGRRFHGFLATGRSWVTVAGFTVTRSEDRGVYLTGACENVTLSRNTVTFSGKPGIQIVGGFGMDIGSNIVTDNLDHGIALTGGVSACVIEDNESARNAHPTQVSANGIYLYGSPGNILRRNRLHHNQDTGLHIQSGSNNCSSYLNRCWSNGDHGFDHQSATGTIHVCDVAYGNHRDGFSLKGSSTGTRIHNSIATDNGLTTNQFDLMVDPSSNSGFVSSHNVLWNSNGQAPVKYAGTPYTSVAAYAVASGQGASSLQSDPRFVDPANGDFHLQAGSPAIDNASSGVPQWPALDAEGHARKDDAATPNTGTGPVSYADRGAFEFDPGDQAPVLTAPATISAPEASPLTLTVTAADPDGQAISSLTADLSGLPAGATFTPGPGNATGTVSWTPGYFHAGTYSVSFFASAGALAATATTAITITNVDRAPVVVAPAAASVAETGVLSVTVNAADPDDEALTALTANLSGLPAGHNATFVAGPGNASGTLTWTPTYADSGSYSVSFTVANAMNGSGTTLIHVANLDRAPTVSAPPATVAEASPLVLTVTAADIDGDAIALLTANLSGLPAGHNAVFT